MTRRSISGLAVWLLVLLTCVGCAGPEKAPEPPLTQVQRDGLIDSFDEVWETIRTRHWDPELGGLDWEGAKAELRPRVESAETRSDAIRVLQELVGRLGISHMAVIPANDDHEEDEGTGGSGRTGIDARVLDGEVCVTSVAPGSSAAEAGVHPGWVITAIGDKDAARWLERFMKRHGDSTLLDLKQHQSILQRLQRPQGGSVDVTLRLGDGSRRTLKLECRAPKDPGSSLGNMPAVPIRFRTERLGGDVGYIAFDAFMDPLTAMPAFEAAVKTYRDTKAVGVILDLRGNPGGIAGMSTGMAGWFIGEEDQSLGTLTSRAATLQFVINPRLEPFTGKLAILIDGCSASTSEIMAGGLKDIGRARIFGTRSAGAALPSVIAKLPSGELFQYVIANFTSKGGEQLEGNGVEPDETVALTRKALLAGRDSVLEAALRWIRTR